MGKIGIKMEIYEERKKRLELFGKYLLFKFIATMIFCVWLEFK